ncbi:MAG: MarR family transcriptional regulator [Peptostreptococcaceae bacterium]|nr:MarR family transcriptional regulator [Peptostreptococcaceae bacterium]
MNKDYIIYYITRIRKKSGLFIENLLKAKGLDGLCASHETILSALYAEDRPLAMKDISNRISRNKSTTSQLVDKLVKFGYAEKIHCKNDRRVNYVFLTQNGKDIQANFQTISAELIETAYENFSTEEIEELLRLLKKLSNNFK